MARDIDRGETNFRVDSFPTNENLSGRLSNSPRLRCAEPPSVVSTFALDRKKAFPAGLFCLQCVLFCCAEEHVQIRIHQSERIKIDSQLDDSCPVQQPTHHNRWSKKRCLADD